MIPFFVLEVRIILKKNNYKICIEMPPKTAAPKVTKKTTETKEVEPVPEVKAPVEPPKPIVVEPVVAPIEQAPVENATPSEVSNIEVLFNKYITQII